MKAKDTLWHVNFGDNDNSFVIAPDKETARERMGEGKEMVNYVVNLDALYQQIFKAGHKNMLYRPRIIGAALTASQHKMEKIRERLTDILAEDLIELGSVHENSPPGIDCGEKCGVSLASQIAASNPIVKPFRSSGEKHQRCMDCWHEYIDGLVTRLLSAI